MCLEKLCFVGLGIGIKLFNDVSIFESENIEKSYEFDDFHHFLAIFVRFCYNLLLVKDNLTW